MSVDPALSEKRRQAGRIGGRMRWIRHPRPHEDVFVAARQKFRESFLLGHSCKVCPLVEIDQTLPDDDLRKSAENLRRLHYQRIAKKSAAIRGAQ